MPGLPHVRRSVRQPGSPVAWPGSVLIIPACNNSARYPALSGPCLRALVCIISLRLEMLNNAKVDFSILPQPFAAIACSEGNQVAIRIESLGYNVTGIVFTHKAIEERKEAIKAFYRAYNRAIDYLNDKPIDDFAVDRKSVV